MARSVLWLCAAFCVGWVCGDLEERVVRIEQGPVRGYKEDGDNIFVFYGIPYATAPVGRDKFKAPGPAPTWQTILDAVDKDTVCPQVLLNNFTIPNTKQREDCLNANVYVPDTEHEGLPVIVYVHGGAYQVGSGVLFEAKNLVRSEKIIMVTFNYRLGVHGFLCLGTEDVPGNAGMKDTVALLHWVQKNIASFGGNPKDVTLGGYSAGSSAVDLLMLSPLTKGLFNKVIPESGASLSPWSVQIDPIENARSFEKSVGFVETDDIYALEEFFKSASSDLLKSNDFFDRMDFTFVFSPCVERTTKEEPFLTDNPYNILKSGQFNKVPVLIGFASMEGLLRIGEFDKFKDKMNANFSDFLPIDLKFDSENERNDVSKKVKEFYFGDQPVGPQNILSYIDFMSDLFFGYSTLKSVQYNVEAGNNHIYLYEFNFVDDSAPAIPHTDNLRGATHCAQTFAVFDGANWESQDETNLSQEHKKMKAITREIWLNFITTGKPVPAGSPLPAWPAAGAEGGPHMSLGRALELRGALLQQRARFWDHIYQRHYRKPQPPPHPQTSHIEL